MEMRIDGKHGGLEREAPQPGLLLACTLEMEALHPDVAAHGRVVATHVEMVAADLGFAGERATELKTAAMLHDIGKVAIPRRVLDKPGSLTMGEWDLMRTHPSIGALILHKAGLDEAADRILTHHERPDGRGYPSGLAGAEIPLEARLIAVADAYDAMTTHRHHQEAVSHEEALEELRLGSGTQFDPEVVNVFTGAVSKLIEGTVPSPID